MICVLLKQAPNLSLLTGRGGLFLAVFGCVRVALPAVAHVYDPSDSSLVHRIAAAWHYPCTQQWPWDGGGYF